MGAFCWHCHSRRGRQLALRYHAVPTDGRINPSVDHMPNALAFESAYRDSGNVIGDRRRGAGHGSDKCDGAPCGDHRRGNFQYGNYRGTAMSMGCEGGRAAPPLSLSIGSDLV